MLLRHSVLYLFARGIPALVGFATIIVFTRLMPAAAYGQYSLVVTGTLVVNAVFYQWLYSALLRYLPQDGSHPGELMAAIRLGFVVVSILVGALGALGMAIWWGHIWGGLIALGVLLSWAQAWFTLNLELARGRLAPIRYGLLSMLRATLALGLGSLLVVLGFAAHGAVTGMLAGFLFAGIWASWGQWRNAVGIKPGRERIASLLRYGLPLTASFALMVVISATDRFMLAAFLGESATGLFAAGQGLAQQTVGILMTMVNLAAYPIILRTLENSGAEAARRQLHKNAILLLGIGLPATAIFVLLPREIAHLFLGQEFRAAATVLMPWLAVATLLSSMRSYYYDLAFHLGEKTRWQTLIMATAAICNVVLNYLLIPAYGLVGAAYGSLAALVLATLLSAGFGRSAFRLPDLTVVTIKLLAATSMMASAIALLPNRDGIAGLVLPVLVGGAVYVSSLLALDIPGLRANAARLLKFARP